MNAQSWRNWNRSADIPSALGVGQRLRRHQWISNTDRQSPKRGFGNLYVSVSDLLTLSVGHTNSPSQKCFHNTDSEQCLLEAQICSTLLDSRLFFCEGMPRELHVWSECPSLLLQTSAVHSWWDLARGPCGALGHCYDPHRLVHHDLILLARPTNRFKLLSSKGQTNPATRHCGQVGVKAQDGSTRLTSWLSLYNFPVPLSLPSTTVLNALRSVQLFSNGFLHSRRIWYPNYQLDCPHGG